jgi:hypothetical protein
VTSYSSITYVANEAEVTLAGTQKGENSRSTFEYTVLYEKGTLTQESNVRTDTVTNNRPGIILKKAKWDGTTPLEGAVFTLKDGDTLIGTFTSDDTGLITIAFLSDDKNYTLTETKTPKIPEPWVGLTEPLTLLLHSGTVSVTGGNESYYILEQGEGKTPTLTIKNRPYVFQAKKIDALTKEEMQGVKFELHKQHTVNGVVQINPSPMDGYTNLTTNEAGIIPKIDGTLTPGVYELRETGTLQEYVLLSGYIDFEVAENGKISLISAPAGVSFTSTYSEDTTGTVTYVLTIENMKKGLELPATGGMGDLAVELPGAVIALSAAALYRRRKKRYDR